MKKEAIHNLYDHIVKSAAVRRRLTRERFDIFFSIYFSSYISYETAPFQVDLMNHLAYSNDNLFIVAFRGSGKSTIVTTAYVLWSLLGSPKKKFVLISFKTVSQARQHMANLRNEFEANTLLKNDLGPFREESSTWGSYSLVFPKLGARISVVSTEQSIRGLRHHQHRPDLIVCDDVEDMDSTRTRDSRNKTSQWFRSEIIPAGDRDTRIVVVGNLLHEDSLLMRIKQDIEEGYMNGKFLSYPLLNQNGVYMWPGKYSTNEDLEREKKKVGNIQAWQREYLLHIVPNEDQVVPRDWVTYYDELPNDRYLIQKLISVDPAISQKETADYTAIVQANVYRIDDKPYVFILPEYVNKRMNFPDIEKMVIDLYRFGDYRYSKRVLVEDVAFQRALIDRLEVNNIDVKGISVRGIDKRSRLTLSSTHIKNQQILFPSQGSEILVDQIVNFGVEKHDDLVDAFSMISSYLSSEQNLYGGLIGFIEL